MNKSPERVYRIAAAMGLDPQQALNNMIIARAYNSDHQTFLIDGLLDMSRRKRQARSGWFYD